MSLTVSAIIVLVVGYSQLVVSQYSELNIETPFSCVKKLGTDSSHPAKSRREIYNYNIASCGLSGLTTLTISLRCIVTWS